VSLVYDRVVSLQVEGKYVSLEEKVSRVMSMLCCCEGEQNPNFGLRGDPQF